MIIWELRVNITPNDKVFATSWFSCILNSFLNGSTITFWGNCYCILVCEEQADDEEYDRHDREWFCVRLKSWHKSPASLPFKKGQNSPFQSGQIDHKRDVFWFLLRLKLWLWLFYICIVLILAVPSTRVVFLLTLCCRNRRRGDCWWIVDSANMITAGWPWQGHFTSFWPGQIDCFCT